MDIVRHLSDEELDDLLLESDEHCLRPALNAMSKEVDAETKRPEEFWERQEKAIRSRISSVEKKQHSRRLPTLAWIAATVMIVTGLLFLAKNRPDTEAIQTPVETIVDSDHELLVHVEETMQSGGPEALEPAAMLAVEINQHAYLRRTAGTEQKENSHED